MPLQGSQYIQTSEDEVIALIESEFRSQFGSDIDLTESSVFSTLAKVTWEVAAANQESTLQEVYQSAFLDSATGVDLDRVVALIGLRRRPSIHATGVQRFTSDEPVTQDYTIQNGTVIQTDSNSPIEFETTETGTLKYIDGFESGSLQPYTGSKSAFDIVSTHPSEGGYELRAAAASGSHIFHTAETSEMGTEYHVDVFPESNTVPAITFGVQGIGDYYQAVIDTDNGELRLEKVENGSVTQTIDSQAYPIPSGEHLHAVLNWNLTGSIGFNVLDSTGTEYAVGGADSDDEPWGGGLIGFKSLDSNGQKFWDELTTRAISVNTRAVVGGVHGNVGPNAVTVMPSPPAGVDSTTNLYPIGDTNYIDTTGNQLVVGRNQETDEELRERANNSVSRGGDATHDALVSELVNEVDEVSSVTIYENKTDDDNTSSGGLPPHSFEVVIFGGDSIEIANLIHDKKAITSRDYGGAHGAAVTETVSAESNSQQFDIQFSRPSRVDIDLSMDLITNDSYIGDDELKNRIVQYIGGVSTNGETTLGLGVGEDVIVDQLDDIIIGADDTGVVGYNTNTSSSDITTTPGTTTNVYGLEIISIGENEVGEISAVDGSITIETTEI